MRLSGYAALFGVADLEGDVVRRGAFAQARAPIAILVRHDPRLVAGRWTAIAEDGRGLYVEGALDPSAPAASLAARLIAGGLDGLSIGFRTRLARARPEGGRELYRLDLLEISLVERPMQPLARLATAVAPEIKPAA